MKKKLLFLLPLFIHLLVLSQDDKIEFKNGLMKVVVLDISTKEILIDKPMGKEVSVTYDKYYKSYNIYCLVEDGYTTFKLQYIQTNKDGSFRYKDERPSGVYYYRVYDDIQKDGTLTLTDEELKDMYGGVKGVSSYAIYNLHR